MAPTKVAEATYTVRQPKAPDTIPANARASKMPISRPLITLPTICPRFSGGAR